jgi:hypothetical protein
MSAVWMIPFVILGGCNLIRFPVSAVPVGLLMMHSTFPGLRPRMRQGYSQPSLRDSTEGGNQKNHGRLAELCRPAVLPDPQASAL